jgi:hypothetical protein
MILEKSTTVDISFAYLFTSLNFMVIAVMAYFLFGKHIFLMRIVGACSDMPRFMRHRKDITR